MKQTHGTRTGAGEIVVLLGNEGADLRLRIEIGRREPDGFERAPAVAHAKEGLGPEPPGGGPPPPLLLDEGRGVDQDTIQIENDGGTLESFHGA